MHTQRETARDSKAERQREEERDRMTKRRTEKQRDRDSLAVKEGLLFLQVDDTKWKKNKS